MRYKEKQTNKNKKKNAATTFWTVVVLIGLVTTSWFLIKNKAHADFSPISVVSNIASPELKETDGRTNILILGSDRRTVGPVDSELTDTILVASIGKVDKDVVLISIPRDLWVQDSKNHYMKVNGVYAVDSYDPVTGTVDKAKGTQELKTILENVLGIPIHYNVLVNFTLFKDTINLLGGISVNVDKEFTDYYYPVEGKENAPDNERYEIVHFAAGTQVMDGDKALKFARSRKGDNDEGTDFARARRQQKVIMAIKDKALSLQTLINPQRLKDLYDLYSKNIETNIDLVTLQNFYMLSQKIKFDKVVSVVLDDRSEADSGGLLYSPQDTSLYGGAYVLIPRAGDNSQIHAYVQRYLFGEK